MNLPIIKFLLISVLLAIITDSESASVQITAYSEFRPYGLHEIPKEDEGTLDSCLQKVLKENEVFNTQFIKLYKDCMNKYVVKPMEEERKKWQEEKNRRLEERKAECRANPPVRIVPGGNEQKMNCETLQFPYYPGRPYGPNAI